MDINQKNKTISFDLTEPNRINRLNDVFAGQNIVRFAITESSKKEIKCDYAALSENHNNYKNIFDFNPREYVDESKFNAVMIIPTGIGAEMGGDSGDACVVAKLIGSSVDTLITHPNVVNAADINEMTPNTLYIEGSILNRFVMGTVGLSKKRNNRMLLIFDKVETMTKGEPMPDHIRSATINTASATRISIGMDIDTLELSVPPAYKAFFDDNGMAVGSVINIDSLIDVIEKYKNDYDCFALHTVVAIDDPFITEKYFNDEIETNPWGGLEGMITHTISNLTNVPTAHAPLLGDGSYDFPYSIVDPTKAAETVSSTELFCVLKGLSSSPKIITDLALMQKENVLTNENISCLIIPDRCIGLPVLAALEQGIPVIAVNDGQNMMKNDLDMLPWKPGKFFRAYSYLEVVGYINCLKNGIAPHNLTRPIKPTIVLTN